MNVSSETEAIAARYSRRDATADARRYSLYANAAALQAQQERLRAIIHLWRAHGWSDLSEKSIVEVGCGSAGNLLDLLRLGATPACLTGLELIHDRAMAARAVVPSSVRIVEGDASTALVETSSQQAVLAFTLFSSILDHSFRHQLAQMMWSWVAPGGGILVYDFTMNNPRNPDVRGMPLRDIQALFPLAQLRSLRLTLAPLLTRRLPYKLIVPASALLYPLRTHRLTWAVKAG